MGFDDYLSDVTENLTAVLDDLPGWLKDERLQTVEDVALILGYLSFYVDAHCCVSPRWHRSPIAETAVKAFPEFARRFRTVAEFLETEGMANIVEGFKNEEDVLMRRFDVTNDLPPQP